MFNPAYFYEAGKDRFSKAILTFDTSKVGTDTIVEVPFTGGFYGIVDWGDGYTERVDTPGTSKLRHIYTQHGVYDVTLDADVSFTVRFYNNPYRDKLIELKSWGKISLSAYSFYGVKNVDMSQSRGVPTLSTDLAFCFYSSGVSTVNNLENWVFLPNTNVISMFQSAKNFNSKLPTDLTNILDFSRSLWGTAFNQPLNHLFHKDVIIDTMLYQTKSLSPQNLDMFYVALRNSVVNTGRTQSKRSVNATPTKYTSAGASARQDLINDGWSITDGGQI